MTPIKKPRQTPIKLTHRHQRNAHVPNPRLRQMLIGYARVSKADGSQSLDLQRNALIAACVDARQIYSDRASGKER